MSKHLDAGSAVCLFTLACVVVGVAACARPPAPTPSGEGGWLAGTSDEKFETVARQLRGFDMAMVETGYRYNELYWAARDRNWGYADYQAKKIRTAIENGLQRRPKRAPSAETFLRIVLPAVEDAIARRDARLLEGRLGTMRAACNTCHAAEKVEFVQITEPLVRFTTVSASANDSRRSPTRP
jgi:hypothetical protein